MRLFCRQNFYPRSVKRRLRNIKKKKRKIEKEQEERRKIESGTVRQNLGNKNNFIKRNE